MNKRLCSCVALFFAVPNLSGALPNVSQAPAGSPIVERDRAEGLIKLDVVVTDAGGKPVAGLERGDFNLLEEGQPQKILSFQEFTGQGAGLEPPVKIILLVDTIQLPPNLASEERNSVESYLRTNGGHLPRPVSVFMLADSGLWTVSHPSGDGQALAREVERNEFMRVRANAGWQRGSAPALAELRDPPSESALKALAQIAADERTRPGRKLLLWIGPGWGIGTGAYADAKSGSPPVFSTVCWFSALLREAHLALYSFAVGESANSQGPIKNAHGELYKDYLDGVRLPRKASFMNLYRKVLAVQSGGRVMDDSLDVGRLIEQCVQEAGYFYRISFDPFRADHPDEYHGLKVDVNRPGLNARTTTGYYDQPYYSTDQIPALKRISIEQLKKILELDESDADKAKQLTGLELTERLSERRLSSLNNIAHGKRTRQEVRLLADASTFLDPPADEILAEPAPDQDAQKKMLSKSSEYLENTIRKLPDLFAKQTTVRFQETPMYLEGDTSVNYQPLHVTDSWTTTVRYSNGFEMAEAKPPRHKPNDPELITYGIFGPVLKEVHGAIDKDSGLTWNRWEQGSRGRMAVFRYTVSTDTSHYEVRLCCLPDGDGSQAFQRYTGYHVDVAIDPGSGVIQRLQFRDDLKSTTPQTRSDIAIEYGPVEIGGKTYFCPMRSVSIVRGRSVRVVREWDQAFRAWGPYGTMLNDVSFDGYHMFRSESHM
ncbi:MAG TPA: VWA domain-containing protein, partial [Terracidiphilus sp.]